MSPRRWFGVAILVVALLAAACERETSVEPPEPIRPQWQRLTLPVPAGEPGRLMVRDIATCAGRWYVVGAVGGAQGATRPAAWTSTDAVTWTSMPVSPVSYYGRQNVFSSAACRDGRVALIGAKTGGAHAYPRISTWRQLPDGSLAEVEAARFELYGGPRAVNVARITAGPSGWMMVGNRSGGAAVWLSPDSAEFEIIEDVPELATDGRGVPWAFDGIPTPGGWLMVGGLLPVGRIDRDPLAWTSADGRVWQRQTAPGTPVYEEMQRVALVNGTPVAVGLRGSAFAAWRHADGGWVAAGGFGTPSPVGVVPAVVGLAAAGDQLLAAISDGTSHALWSSPDEGRSWRPVTAPLAMPAGANREVTLLTGADRLLLAADDGQEGSLWWTGIPSGR